MRENLKKSYKFALIVLTLGLIITGCSSNPPGKESVEKHFQENYNDIQTVVEFMCNSEYDSIHINTADGTMWADFEDGVVIEEKSVRDAIGRLLGASSIRQYYYVYKSGNTIDFLQWKGIAEISSGVAYSINGTDLPYIDYPTVLEPMSEPGWYYYVDDYNTWRSEHS